MTKIRIITAFPQLENAPLRKLDDLLPFQKDDVTLSLSSIAMGALHIQSDFEHALATAAMATAAMAAEQDGVDAIVIESMGDTGIIPAREMIQIPIVGMSDVTMRIAGMLGHRFGLVTANDWHGHALERIMASYYLDTKQYIGFEPLRLQPFFTDAANQKELHQKMVAAIQALAARGADSIVLGGSYFLGATDSLKKLLEDVGLSDMLIIDPLPTAIHFARLLVDANLSHSKRYYVTPTHATQVIGYPTIPAVPVK